MGLGVNAATDGVAVLPTGRPADVDGEAGDDIGMAGGVVVVRPGMEIAEVC